MHTRRNMWAHGLEIHNVYHALRNNEKAPQLMQWLSMYFYFNVEVTAKSVVTLGARVVEN